MVNTPVDINQLKQLATTGHFRSIALWLNYPLVPQSIYAQVQTDRHPGYLQVLLEFERPPKQDKLIRLVCNRICQLESDVIQGIFLVGRLVGTAQPLWQKRVRLSSGKRSSAQRPQKTKKIASPVAQPVEKQLELDHATNNESADLDANSSPTESLTEKITTTTYCHKSFNTVPSYLIPREANHQERRRRLNRNITPFPVVEIRPAKIDSSKTPAQRRSKRRRLLPQDVIEQQFNYMRAIIVTGSAAATFILGCVAESVVSQRSQLARKVSPSLPTFKEDGWRTLSDGEVQEIAYRSATRGPAVSAALEPVAVMPHASISNPEDPTVTLMFGGDVPVGDVPLQTPDAVGQVLSDLEMFREADVAMVGLGNSLASADTSLQENYLDRTRPEAVDALRQGGIDIVGLTSNQTMDFGRQGLTETLEALDSAGIYRVGAGRNYQEARRPEVLDVKGQRIAYLSYAPGHENDVNVLGKASKAGLNHQSRDSIVEDIAALRQGVDWIVVNYRWYGDLDAEPSSQQVNLSRSAIDAGADLVVGYHPNQLQGAELYKSRPIVYALGDFIFQDAPLDDHDTAALRVSLREKQMKVEFLPVSVRDARPQEASEKAAKSVLKQIRQASDVLPSPLQFPAILDAPPRDGSLLQPEKSDTPLKTLGELEPSSSESHSYEDAVPAFDVFSPDIQQLESFEPYQLAPSWEEPGRWGTEYRSPEVQEMPVNGSLDRFDSQFDEMELETWDSESESTPVMETDISVDLDSGIDHGGEDATAELMPGQSEDILIPSDQPWSDYNTLDNWGQKSSPHKEFKPIQDDVSSGEPANALDPSQVPPMVPVETEKSDFRDPSEAVSPHDEPLVGPLTYQSIDDMEADSGELASL